MKPVRALAKLSKTVRSGNKAEYIKGKADFISDFGDRCPEELKLETKTFLTNPEMVDEKVKEFLTENEKADMIPSGESQKTVSLPKDFLTRFISTECLKGIRNRETQRLNRSRIFGMVREAVLRMGRILVDTGCIDNVRDVFYLELDEVRALCKKAEPVQKLIAKRKEQHDMFEQLPAYSRIVFAEKEFDKNHRSINNACFISTDDNLKGIACSGGTVEGEAYVVTDIKKPATFTAKYR